MSIKIKKNYNKKHIDMFFNTKNQMYFNAKNVRFIRFFKKLNYKYYDSYIIVELIEKKIYKLEFSFELFEIHDVFHVFLLKFVNENRDTKISSIKINDESK